MKGLGTQEILIDQLDDDKWMDYGPSGLRQYIFWENEETGASITLLEFPEGAGIPEAHSHASNQFMYCLEGEYEYTTTQLVLKPGSFYFNPKDHPHGPTIARKRSLLIEIYDGPHYYDVPGYHTEETVGKLSSRDDSD